MIAHSTLTDEQLVMRLLESPWERLVRECRRRSHDIDAKIARVRRVTELGSWLCSGLVSRRAKLLGG